MQLIRGVVLALCLVAATVGPSTASAALGVSSFDVALTDDGGLPMTQAGAHPNLVTRFVLASRSDGSMVYPTGTMRNVEVTIPKGIIGDPTAYPVCKQSDLTAQGTPLFPSLCPPATQIGVVTLYAAPCATDTGCPLILPEFPVYNTEHGPDIPAALGFNVFLASIWMKAEVDAEDGYAIRVVSNNISQSEVLLGLQMTLWGVPEDHFGVPSGNPRRPYLRSPTSCSDSPDQATLKITSWQDDPDVTVSTDVAPATGCENLPFAPTVDVTPASTEAGAPAAYDVEIHVPQTDDPSARATADLRNAVVALPKGVALSPSVANGLEACADEQLDVGTSAAPACPDASKIGTVSIDTPLLDEPLTGGVYVGQQKSGDPQSGNMFRIFLTAEAQGVQLKLPGRIAVDPSTGQLTATFDDNPQLPFSDLTLSFKGGDRAPMVNPTACGTATTSATFTSWAGSTATDDSSFEVTGCSSAFAPTFEAGTTDPKAGAFAPFTMTVKRTDADEELAGLSLQLPPGLLGILPGIALCDEGAAAAGTCPEATRVGSTTVSSGAGNQPFSLAGKVFLAGAYKGAPYSLVVAVPAVAGPYDLGMVTVRVPLKIDAANASVGAPSDPLPTIVKGVPLRLKMINITLDRPGFMFNATDCTKRAVTATLTSVTGKTATVSSPYQPSGCADLPLNPQLTLGLSGKGKDLRKKGHPALTAHLAQPRGDAGLKSVKVTLPSAVSVDLKNVASFCTAADAAARKCPDAAIVGKASAVTPALPAALSGPIYLIENKQAGTAALPRLWLKLEGGGVPLDLYADTAFSKTNRLITTFGSVPDAPISSFDLEIAGGTKGILQATTDVCTASRSTSAQFDGQNGKRVFRMFKAVGSCTLRVARTRVVRSTVKVTVSGAKPGTLRASGRGVRPVSRTNKASEVVTLTVPLSQAAKRQIARKGKARVRIAVVQTDTSGRKTTVRKSLTVRRAQVTAPAPFRSVKR